MARQVSELAELEVELSEERNPAIADSQVAEATLHLKGVTLRARDASPDMIHSINLARRARRPGQAPPRQAAQAARVPRRGGQVPPTLARGAGAGGRRLAGPT